jgi:hypothetical protein
VLPGRGIVGPGFITRFTHHRHFRNTISILEQTPGFQKITGCFFDAVFAFQAAQGSGGIVELCVKSYDVHPNHITLDIDATGIKTHGHQAGGVLTVMTNIAVSCPSGLIRAHWPKVKILVRGDNGFARRNLISWCEANRVDYIFGLARTPIWCTRRVNTPYTASARAALCGKAIRASKPFSAPGLGDVSVRTLPVRLAIAATINRPKPLPSRQGSPR